MYSEDLFNIKYGVQVIFTTIPNKHGKKFIQSMDDDYFAKYKEQINSKDRYLYRPLKYFMLGDYDICYISLINNFKFAHRLFEPTSTGGPGVGHFNSHTFQSYSGFARNASEPLENLFAEQPQNNFIGVIHLKLNNGLYLGNGLEYIKAIEVYLDGMLKGIPYLLTQTFSWFELSLAIFIDKPQDLTNILIKLRTSKFYKIAKQGDSLFENCLYNCEFFPNKEDILMASLFSDTNSNIGFHHRLIEANRNTKIYKDFLTKIESKDSPIKLKTEIEWQVKPGYVSDLLREISNHEFLRDHFELDQKNLVLGKTDYLIQEVDNESIVGNFHLIRDIFRDKDCKFFTFARKVRTNVFLAPLEKTFEKCEDTNGGRISSETLLNRLAVPTSDVHNINVQLKSLKVSRQLRSKILKILSNYNNGILDPILFSYFLDFTVFKDRLIDKIFDSYQKIKGDYFEIKKLEKILDNYVKVFQEGYNVRFLNGYQFENISDFDLDFNSSIQQLLTSYSSVVYAYGKLFYEKKTYFPILQLNNLDTESDYISINYSVHHLTSPEFVFATLIKEILNHIRLDNEELVELLGEIEDLVSELRRFINESYFDDLLDSEMIDINYFIIDAIRCHVTFGGNFKLFEHWFWAYNFQNSSLYDTSGMFNEQHLRVEMFRLMLVQKFFDDGDTSKKEINKLRDPAPEMYTFWVRHFDMIDKITDQIFNYATNHRNHGNAFCRLKDFINRMSDTAKQVLEADDKLDEFNSVAITALKNYYYKNGKENTLLKRSWDDGTIQADYFPLYESILFAVDQTGGVFFSNTDKIQEYFELNSKFLLHIIDFSARQKKGFIMDSITKPSKVL